MNDAVDGVEIRTFPGYPAVDSDSSSVSMTGTSEGPLTQGFEKEQEKRRDPHSLEK